MCLITDWDKPRIAKENIICYKWYGMLNFVYVSPYRGKPMPDSNIVTYSDLSEPEILHLFTTIPKYTIEKGFHSFVNYIDAERDSHHNRDAIIVSCVIPKGSRYYKGVFGGMESYCSEAIIIEKLM